MSKPRNLYPDTWLYVTVRCVHRSHRLVPTSSVQKVFAYCFGYVSSKYRQEWGMEFYEAQALSTHYHLVLYDRDGKVADFLQDLNAMIARELNAVRGTGGTFFAGEPGLQTILGEERLFEHCVYTLANAVAAGLVHKTSRWKGFQSLRREYGEGIVVHKPRIGMWAKKKKKPRPVRRRSSSRGASRRGTRRAAARSGRGAYAGRSRLPETVTMVFDRPRIRMGRTDTALRAEIRAALATREDEVRRERKGRRALGMKAVLATHWSTVPRRGEEMFGRNPTFSTQTHEQRRAMKRLRRRFVREHAAALARYNAGERDVVFPAGTVRMRLRHKVETDPTPLALLLAG